MASSAAILAFTAAAAQSPVDLANPLVGTAPLDDPAVIGNAPPPGEPVYSGQTSPGARLPQDRKSVVLGTSVSVRVDLGGRRTFKTKRQMNILRAALSKRTVTQLTILFHFLPLNIQVRVISTTS